MKTLFHYLRILFLAMMTFFIGVGCLSAGQGPELAYLMTYGTDAGTVEGDDDFVQIIFIKIPDSWTRKLHIRIFDADCGGRHDEMFSGRWDTRTSYRLYGGQKAYSAPGLNHPMPSRSDLYSGELITTQEFGEDSSLDDRWHTLSNVSPSDGELVDGFRYFKLVVEGRHGNDGNAYLVVATPVADGRDTPEALSIFSYKPTIRLPRTGVFSEMRFFVPKEIREISVHNFDLSGAKIGVDTVFRTNLKVPSSGQGRWIHGKVDLNADEVGRMCAIRFEGGREMPNDGTFYVSTSTGKLLPIKLTVFLQIPNLRATPRIAVKPLTDCLSFRFDGARTFDSEGDQLRFYWDFGDGRTGQGVTVSHTYASPGKYLARVVIQDDSGQIHNSIVERFTVTVNHPPVAISGANRVAAPQERIVFDASASYDTDGRIRRYRWDFGDGRKASGSKVVHQYRQPGKYSVTLSVDDDSGTHCQTATDTLLTVVNAAPLVNLGADRHVAVGETIPFSGVDSQDTDGQIIAYEWNFGDWSRKSGKDVTHIYRKPGKYAVTLRLTDDSGANNASSSGKVNVIVNTPPVADVGGPYRGSVGEPIAFDGTHSRDEDGRILEWEWDFGDGTRQKLSSGVPARVSHVYAKPQKYRVTLTVKDDSGTISALDSAATWVVVNHPPKADAGPDMLGTDGRVRFNAAGSSDPDGDILEYRWDFGDGATGRGLNPTHVYQSPGAYTVRLTVVDDSATSTNKATDDMMVTVNHQPIADAGQDRIGIPNQPLVFDASASIDPDGEITNYVWDFGDGTSAEGIRPSHVYDKPGRYTALLSVKDDSGQRSAIGFDGLQVIINHPPVAIAGADLRVATHQPVTFDGSRSYDPDGRIAEYRWEFGDQNTTHRKPKIVRSFARPGIYTATLSVVDNLRIENSTSRDKLTIRVNHPPLADCGKEILTSQRTIVLDASNSTDADGDVLSYTWDFGDGTPPQKGPKVYHTYTKGGRYPVILTVDDGTGLSNSRSTTSIAVNINDPPVANAGGNRTVCAGKPILFDGSHSIDPEGGRMKYHWDFGDGTSAEVVNPAKIYNNGGIYLVTLTVTDDSGLQSGASATEQIAVTVAESPVAEAGPDQIVCAGTPVQFNGIRSKDVDGLVNSYHWNFGDGTVGGGPTPTHTYDHPGTYNVALTITGDQLANCNNTDVDEMVVKVHQAPQADFTSPNIIEFGQPIHFKALAGTDQSAQIKEVSWDFGDGNRGNGIAVAHTYTKPGNYLVRLTVQTTADTACNRTTRQKQVVVNASPTAQATASGIDRSANRDYLVGVNQVVVFNGAGSEDPDGIIKSYQWHFGNGHQGNGAFVRYQYPEPGKYKVDLIVKDNAELTNSVDSDTLYVTVNAAPRPIISSGDIFCPGETITLDASDSMDPDGQILRYTWSFGDGTADEEGQSIAHTFRYPGRYSINLLVDDGTNVNNGRAQTHKVILINEPPSVDAGVDQLASPGARIVFNAVATDRDGKIQSYQWDLGDGTRKTGKRVVHRYPSPGIYKAHLKVADDSGTGCSSAEDDVTIRINATPVAVIKTGNDQAIFDLYEPLLFDATSSRDPDNDPLSFSWEFGDGGRAEGPKVMHRFSKPGLYTVKLRVDDGTRLKSSIAWSSLAVRVK